MLKDGVVLIVILLIVVGGFFVWWTKAPVQAVGTVTDHQWQQPEAPPKPAHVVVKATSKPKLPDQPVPEITGFDPTTVTANANTAAASVVHRDPPPFPAVDQIRAGVRGDSITGKYGDPTVSTVTSTGGHVVETMVYARESGRTATVIRIEDGKVSSVYSQVQPVAPPGLSAPRRWHNE